jgi:hypothetical protein
MEGGTIRSNTAIDGGGVYNERWEYRLEVATPPTEVGGIYLMHSPSSPPGSSALSAGHLGIGELCCTQR